MDLSKLWEDEHFVFWENFEEKFREPIEESHQKFDAADGIDEARAWLIENDIDAEKLPFACKLVGVDSSWDYDLPEIEHPVCRIVYQFKNVGARDCLVFPISENGEIVDYGILHTPDFTFATVRQKAIWLGGDNITGDEVRLHSSVERWLSAGATGCVYIDQQRRTPMKRLQAVTKIFCDDVELALEAWDWGFGADDAALDRFEIDDTPENIESYFKAMAERRAISQALNSKHPGRFNLVAA
ncbi:hypothetical protein [Rhizobium aegyptiacum]|uniref:hypothetical protein n=1 Tax=Rhizobium aegyptiacum TaxID=1764550 RepID=UPI0007E57076|nr:hypothetical protein [Rhizobium aegyptiacum]